MAEVPEGSFTHTLEDIDAAVTQVESTKGQAASLTAAVTAIAETEAAEAAEEWYEYGTLIPDNSDFDDYYNLGTFYVPNNTSAATMDNAPKNADGVKNGGKLIVMQTIAPISDVDYVKQFYITNTDEGRIYSRRKLSSGWSDWVEYTTTPVVKSAAFSVGVTISSTQSNPFDLNTLQEIGRRYFGPTARGTMLSLPSDFPSSVGGEVIVDRIQTMSGYRQTIVPNSNTNAGKRWERIAYGGTAPNINWSAWYRFEGTQV